MSASQNLGVLRVVRVRPAIRPSKKNQERYPAGWQPGERLVYLLTRHETMIGRALNCDLVLMDPGVSREHARLVLDEQGWHIVNLTTHNIVRVNGHIVAGGRSMRMKPQDILVLGGTMLQLIAPQEDGASSPPVHGTGELPLERGMKTVFPPLRFFLPSVAQSAQEHEAPAPPLVPRPAAELVQLPSLAHGEPVADEPEECDDGDWGIGITMQFALSRRLGARMLWVVVGAFIVLLTIGAITALIVHNVGRISILVQEGPLTTLTAFSVPLIPAVGIALLVNFIDRFEREPWFLRLAAFLWGAVIAISLTVFTDQYSDAWISSVFGPMGMTTLSIARGLRTGILEETAKGIGLLLLFVALRDEFDNVTDGIVYGALIGAGFAMMENFFYFADNPRILLFLFVGRIVLGWLCHSTFTVCFGVALGYIRHTRVRWKQLVIPLLGYLAAVGLHSFFDFVNTFANGLVFASPDSPTVALFSLIAVVGDYIPPFIAQVVIVYILIKSLAHEAALIREFLAAEVSKGVITVDEYALLQHSSLRISAERQVLWRSGWRQWLRVTTLYQTEIGLAFRKWHVSMGDKPKPGLIQPEDAYRQRIRRLRQEIQVAETLKKGSSLVKSQTDAEGD